VNYLLIKSKYKNYFLFLVCGFFSFDFIYSGYFGFGIANKDPMVLGARIISIGCGILFGLTAIQYLLKILI
jgi:hypothetical protein